MKALTLAATGGIEQLRVRELPSPSIQSPDDVLVKVRAAALNRLDLFVAAGLPGASLAFPHVVGSDGAGLVQQAGSGVSQFRPGDRVMINKEELTMAQFPGRVREILRGNTSKMVFFSGGRDVDYEATMKFLDLARASGARNIGIIVEDPIASPAASAIGQ